MKSKQQKFKVVLEPFILKVPQNYTDQLELGHFKNAREMLEHLFFCEGFYSIVPLDKLNVSLVEKV